MEPPDGYNIRGNQRTITLYQEQISVSLTPPTANGSANTATSSSIEFQFSRDIGELNNSNIRTTGMTPSGSVPPIVKVSHNTGGTYTATLANIGT
ncbi:hypothetical protein FACS1894218_5760 [Bacilli bacterium]|nr:hypothetical protein FACS1894218_5760 [Bacilli bacterium]